MKCVSITHTTVLATHVCVYVLPQVDIALVLRVASFLIIYPSILSLFVIAIILYNLQAVREGAVVASRKNTIAYAEWNANLDV